MVNQNNSKTMEALTEGDGELFVVNVDHISQLKACLNLKNTNFKSKCIKIFNNKNNSSKFSTQVQIIIMIIFLHLYWTVIWWKSHLVIVGI